MAETLDTLIRLSRWTVDEKRRALAALLAQEEELLERRRRLEEEMVAERQAARDDPEGAGTAFAAYAQRHRERLTALDRAIVAVRARLREAHEQLAEAFRRRKTYEIAQDMRRQREREEAERRDRAALDEIALNQHRRRGKAQKGIAKAPRKG